MAAAPEAGGDGLVAWAARSGRPSAGRPVRGGLRFAFYGRVSTEDWQDPVTSRARQREQAGALVRRPAATSRRQAPAGDTGPASPPATVTGAVSGRSGIES